jgi:hypothetical protein
MSLAWLESGELATQLTSGGAKIHFINYLPHSMRNQHKGIHEPLLPCIFHHVLTPPINGSSRHLGYASWNDTPIGRGFDSHYGFLQGAQDYYYHNLTNGNYTGDDFFRDKQVVVDDVFGIYSLDLFKNEVSPSAALPPFTSSTSSTSLLSFH